MNEAAHEESLIAGATRYVADRTTARRASLAVLRVVFVRPRLLVLWGVAVLLTALGLAGFFPFDRSLMILLLLLLATIAMMLGVTYWVLVWQTSKVLPPGGVLLVRFEPEGFWEHTPVGESTLRFDSFRKVHLTGGFLVFTGRLTKGGNFGGNVLPIEVVPSREWLAYIAAQYR